MINIWTAPLCSFLIQLWLKMYSYFPKSILSEYGKLHTAMYSYMYISWLNSYVTKKVYITKSSDTTVVGWLCSQTFRL